MKKGINHTKNKDHMIVCKMFFKIPQKKVEKLFKTGEIQ